MRQLLILLLIFDIATTAAATDTNRAAHFAAVPIVYTTAILAACSTLLPSELLTDRGFTTYLLLQRPPVNYGLYSPLVHRIIFLHCIYLNGNT